MFILVLTHNIYETETSVYLKDSPQQENDTLAYKRRVQYRNTSKTTKRKPQVIVPTLRQSRNKPRNPHAHMARRNAPTYSLDQR